MNQAAAATGLSKERPLASTDCLHVVPCPRCGSSRCLVAIEAPDRQVPGPEKFQVSRCGGCGLLYQNPRLRAEFLSAHYPDDYAPYAVVDPSLHPATLAYLKRCKGYGHLEGTERLTTKQKLLGRWNAGLGLIPDFVRGGQLLEIGCASGNRLALLRSLGWQDCRGIEYSGAASATARARGFEVLTGPVEEVIAAIPDGTLDVIVAGFVIEHVQDPFFLTRQLAAKLRKGGQFLFSTINIESPDFRLYREHWYNLDLPRHMVFFRRGDLRAMLERDFEIRQIDYAQTFSDYSFSARHRLPDHVPGWRGWLDRSIIRWGNRAGLLWMALAWMGWGSRIHIACRKK